MRYLESGKGRALVLLHGFPLNAEEWLAQLAAAPAGWRVIAPDMRGFRGTGSVDSPLNADMTVDDCASDVIALMSHLEIERAVICGLSMGGYVTLALVKKAPERVAGLVLANTRAGADSAEGRAARDRMIDLVRREGPSAVAREMLPKLLGETTKRDQPDLVDVVRGLAEANTADGLAAAIHAMKTRPDSTPMLGSIRCPTLVITSDEDTLIPPSESEKMASEIPGATLHVIPHAGHLSNLERPKEFSKALFQSSI